MRSAHCTEAESKVSAWGIKSTLCHRDKVDSGIGLPMVNVLESTLGSTLEST
jgi:hypothetical protein